MDAHLWRQVEELYHAVVDLPPAERDVRLAAVDPELRREVDVLLRDRSLPERPAWDEEQTQTIVTAGTQLGPYRIESMLGEGGMGRVFRAVDTRLGRSVAIKTSHMPFDARFQREARAVATLNHPNVCTLYDVGPNYIVIELCEGETLAARIKRGKLSIAETCRLGSQIAAALAAAHSKGIIHRDLKPANIMLTKLGVKVLDFGLAKSQSDSTLTQSNAIMGTPAYMAPEQRAGLDTDHRTDIYALGLVLAEMATGQRLTAGAPEIPGPRQLSHLIERCLNDDPDLRWQSAADIAGQLTWISQEGRTAPSAETLRARPLHSRLLATAPWVLSAALLAALAMFGFLRWSANSDDVRYYTLEANELELAGHVAAPPVVISPDGKHLAYIARLPEKGPDANIGSVYGQLKIRSLNSPEAVAVADATQAYSPFFSGDSRWLFFANGRKLMKMPVEGGPLETVANIPNGIHGGAWLPNGTLILGQLATRDRDPDYKDWGLTQVPATGGALKPLTHSPSGWDSWPVALPDGSAVLYTHVGGGGYSEGLFLLDTATGKSSLLIPEAAHARYVDTGHLLFVRAGALWAVGFDLSSRTTQGDPIHLLDGLRWGAAGEPALAVWDLTQDGTLFTLMGPAATSNLAWINASGTVETFVSSVEPQGPRISPDGRYVSVGVGLKQTKDNVLRQLRIYDLKQGTLYSTIPHPGGGFHSAWTPDSKRIAFNDLGPDGSTASILLTTADGSAPQPFVTSPAGIIAVPYSWSPDGRTLFYSRHKGLAGDADIWAKSVDGDDRPVLSTEMYEAHPAISPDGRKLLYTSRETGNPEVYWRDYPSMANKVHVSRRGGSDPAWGIGGKDLYFRDREQVYRVVIGPGGVPSEPVPVPGSQQLRAGLNRYGRQYEVRPDGLAILGRAESPLPAYLSIALGWREILEQKLSSSK